MEECLPQDTLEAIMGKLDRETLCTARLVSRTFCAAASANISSLALRFPPQALSLGRFPRLGRLRVHHTGDGDSLAELEPRLWAVITHLRVSHGGIMALPDLPGMPNLREVDVDGAHLRGEAAEVLHRLTTLEGISTCCTPSVARTITTMTWLTSLAMVLVAEPGEGQQSADVSWFQHATNLRRLQALHIQIPHEALPFIGNLTGLTGLTWFEEANSMADSYSIAPLSRLSRLRSLKIIPPVSESNLAIACSLGSGSLTKLCIWVSPHASADWGRLLARQTALAWLELGEAQLCTLRHMGPPRVELLQCLELPLLNSLDAEGLDALQKATRFTRLHIGTDVEHPDAGLSRTLGRLTQLRCLWLDFHGNTVGTKVLDFPSALSPLTALTELQVSSDHLEDGELRAVLGLAGLRVLGLHGGRLTDGVVPELTVLTNLRLLNLWRCGVTSLDPVTSVLNPLREARGWPPVHTFHS